jgi:hypothetical protein
MPTARLVAVSKKHHVFMAASQTALKNPVPDIDAAPPFLCRNLSGIAVSAGQWACALTKQVSVPEAFLTRGHEAIFLPHCINMIFLSGELVDAYSAANFATGISDGGRVNPAARALWIRFTICLGLFHTTMPKA